MNEQIGQNLRVYSRQLTAQLKEKEGEFADLQRRFSKLQNRFAQLDYAFKKNLQLHQQQMIAIHDLRLSQKELQKVERDRWGQICKLEEQIIQVTNEKEVTENGLAYWKQAAIDQKIFYEGKFEECLSEWKLRMEADAIVHQKTLKETQSLADKHIRELAHRLKLNDEEGEPIRKKAIMLQGDVDVLRHRTQELACLIDNFPGPSTNSQAIISCVVQVLRSLSTPHDDYDNRMKVLNQELLKRIAHPVISPGENISDYETLKSQNLVLREIIKKLKNELTKFQKSESILSLAEENQEKVDLRKELIQLETKNRKLCDLFAEKDAAMKKLQIKNDKDIAKLEISLELMKSRENETKCHISKMDIDTNNCNTMSKTVEPEKEFVSNSENRENRDFSDDDKNREAYWELREARVRKFKERAMRDITKSLELNFEPLNSGQSYGNNYVTLKDTQEVEDNTESYSNCEKNTHLKLSQGRLQPIESHLNSVQYKEYTISVSKYHKFKIRHPTAQISTEKIFQFRFAYSEEEYHSIPIDETVLYFDCENGEPVFLNSKTTNCAIQTLPISIPKANVFTQTTAPKETFNIQASTGVKILNSESRAIERSLRDLEKTVSEAGKETLGLARSMIVNTKKFPPSEKFFDSIKYLSQCGAT